MFPSFHIESLKSAVAVAIVAGIFLMWPGDAKGSCPTPSFAAPQAFNTRMRAVAVADFNGDGKPDVVAAADFLPKVYVMLNNGAAGLLPPVEFPTGGWPGSVAVGDFNNDQKADVVTSNFNPTNISILLGDGTGNLSAPVNISVGNSSSAFVAVGDFNNDQNQDLAVSNSGSTVAILLGNGSGGFGSSATFAAGDGIRSIAVADFNIDGKPDLAIASQSSSQVSILLGNGSGGFGPATGFALGGGGISVSAQDLNNDGKPDLAVALVSNMAILLNNGDGTFGAATVFAVGGPSPASIVTADFNDDGRNDVAVGHNTGVSIRLGNGAGNLGGVRNTSVGLGPTFLASDDFNGDGSSDLAVSSYSAGSVAFLLGTGNGFFKSAPQFSSNGDANSVVARDFNGDATIDLAVANRNANSVSVYLGDGMGAFAAARVFSVGAQPSGNITNGPISMAAGDFNGDNKADLVTANFTGGGISILLGDGAGNFSAQKISVAGGGSPRFIAVGDFNLDTKADVALTRDGHFSNVTILFGDGTGNFGTPIDFPTSISSSTSITVGDLNGDNKPDLVIGSNSGGEFSTLLNNGSGGFGAPSLTTSNSNQGQSSIAAVGDFTGDGKADLAVANYVRDTLGLFAGDGTGAFSAPAFVSVGEAPNSLATADFNGDGLLDVAVAHADSGAISILLNNGAGGLSSSTSYLAASLHAFVAAADFNGDSLVDLATEGISIFLNTCSGAIPSVPELTISSTSVGESSSNAVFDVLLSAPSAQPVSVQYQTSGQSAVSGADFQPGMGTVNFAPGETIKSIAIPIVDDSINEFRETFLVSLHHPVNATIKKRQGTGNIIDSDPEPTASIAQISIVEGNSGAASALFAITLSSPSGKLITLSYSTANITATAGSDYQAVSGNITTIAAGSAAGTASVLVNGDTVNEADETFSVNLSNAINAGISNPSAVGTIINDDTPTLQFTQSNYSETESQGTLEIAVNRTGDKSAQTTVKYFTSDIAGLQACTVANARASERCDYTTAVGTLTFAAGESSKTFIVSIINDVHVEGDETFTVTLSNPVGGSLGSQTTATVTIIDNDFTPSSQNPIDGVEFFILQMYRDILNRQPDSTGFQNWVNTLAPCPNGGFGEPPTSNCDRLHVASGFFQSDEFLNRGYFAFRFYMVSFNQRPTYAQFIPDMAQVGGPKSPTEEEAAKVAYADAFVQRPEFLAAYSGLSGQALANALLQTAGLPAGSYNAGSQTNGQILRGIAESSAALNKFLTEGTVSILYFGFQRRDPDAIGYQNNLDTLNANPNNLRHMIFIFIYSTEYRNRFGP